MGTNFYWIMVKKPWYRLANGMEEEVEVDRMSPMIHIGKRSAAGLYCWECETTLCQQGPSGIHQAGSTWLKTCPKCGRTVDSDSPSPVVHGSTSFTWAQQPDIVRIHCNKHRGNIIEDEYGNVYTGDAFMRDVADGAKFHFTDSIGKWFG